MLVQFGHVQKYKFLLWHLDVAVEREVEGDLFLGDMGEGVPFRAGAFDGAIRYVQFCYGIGTL